MTCSECALAARVSRIDFDAGYSYFTAHPTDCGCTCQHEPPADWESQFSVEQPDVG